VRIKAREVLVANPGSSELILSGL